MAYDHKSAHAKVVQGVNELNRLKISGLQRQIATQQWVMAAANPEEIPWYQAKIRELQSELDIELERQARMIAAQKRHSGK